MTLEYLKVDKRIMKEYGINAAVLLEQIRYSSKILPKDQNGYCYIDSNYLCSELGLKRNTFLRIRQKLIESHLIACRTGHNQNDKPRYKLL